jgi:menaquinone-dependent protoporphyrinogen oxidase
MKALVVFGSERGGTAGLAHVIAAELRRHGWSTEVRDAAISAPLPDVDAVIVGGALYVNRWHRSARRFVRAHAAALGQVPVWLFSSGPLDDSARSGDIAPVPQVQAIAQRLEARGHMTFGGRLEPTAKGFFAGRMAKTAAGDWRDQGHVAEWVDEICRAFAAMTITLPQQRASSDDVRTTAAAAPRGPRARRSPSAARP